MIADVQAVEGLGALIRVISVCEESQCILIDYHELYEYLRTPERPSLVRCRGGYSDMGTLWLELERFLGRPRQHWRDYRQDPYVSDVRAEESLADFGATCDSILKERKALGFASLDSENLLPLGHGIRRPDYQYHRNDIYRLVDVREVLHPGILRSTAFSSPNCLDTGQPRNTTWIQVDFDIYWLRVEDHHEDYGPPLSYLFTYPSQKCAHTAVENFLGVAADQWRDYFKYPYIDLTSIDDYCWGVAVSGCETPEGATFETESYRLLDTNRSHRPGFTTLGIRRVRPGTGGSQPA